MAGQRGRPVTYTREIADTVCARLASGEALRQICRDEGMPPAPTVREWVVSDRDGFAERYMRARELGWQEMAEETIDIADDGSNDWTERETEKGRVVKAFDAEHVQRSRLRIDTRKWLLSKMLPGLFGERVALTGGDGGAIKTEETGNPVDMARRVAFLLAQGAAKMGDENG